MAVSSTLRLLWDVRSTCIGTLRLRWDVQEVPCSVLRLKWDVQYDEEVPAGLRQISSEVRRLS